MELRMSVTGRILRPDDDIVQASPAVFRSGLLEQLRALDALDDG
jgi:hypothetical protein